IDSIKIVQVDGLTRSSGGAGASGEGGGVAPANGNLASDALTAALSYRAQAPIIDGLMKELGLDGGSLEGLVKAAPVIAEAPAAGASEEPEM
ncbi:MAG: flotillin family protein, partial [Novosphingobium sp.]